MLHRMNFLMAALIAGTTLATAAQAQFGGQPFPGGPGASFPSGPFSGRPNSPGGPFGGGPGGGRSGRMPFAFGSISAVNVAVGTITLAPLPGADTRQTVKSHQENADFGSERSEAV